ncbi:uncharacterized protein [Eurosta solidaginis]|uniref:uncharacterized protein n=1 Tax=Eurosta solidaginis TaxID=178769 RepID=UPI00353131AA
MVTSEIVVKSEVDFEFLANYAGDDCDTQNPQSSLGGSVLNTKTACNANTPECGMQLDTMRQQHASMSTAIQHQNNNDDDSKLMNLLKEFDLELLYTHLKLNDITFRSLLYLTVDDINTAIRHLGYRAEFREKLFVWRKEKLSTSEKSHAHVTQTQTVAPINMLNKKTPTSIVAPAISVQSLHQLQTPQNSQQTSTINTTNNNSNSNNAAATLTVQPSNMATALATTNALGIPSTTTTTTGSATIMKRPHSTQAEEFLSLLPGISGTTTRMSNNMPAVVLEPTFSLMTQTAKSPKLHTMATLSTTQATTTTTATVTTLPTAAAIAMTSTRASTKSINVEQQQQQQFLSTSRLGNSSAGGLVGDGDNGMGNASSSLTTNVGGSSSINQSSSTNNTFGLRSSADTWPPLVMSCPKVDTAKVLHNSQVGQRIKKFYKKNGYLENHQRNEIVRLVVADVMRQGETLSPKDLRQILSDIIAIFPNEQAAADYYFIYRGGKGNPLGRLYQRYSNENVKRRRMIRTSDDDECSFDAEMPEEINTSTSNSLMDEDDTMSTYPQDLPGVVPRVDEMTALALKQLLTTDHFSWEEVCDKWIQTWALRNKELQQSGLADLLSNWSKLADPRAAELYKIDFRHVYPDKENLLICKWEEYIRRVTPQFDKKVHHEDLKKLYKYFKMGMASKDEKDFVFAVGLIALLPTTGRFKDNNGKLSIRANVTDSIESFVMRLSSLESYESRLDLYNRKFGPINRSTHPFLVVIMPNECTISKIYVALENNFYCMQSFLQALDLCYKIYHTCGLKYPTICENVWTFIQRYFYDMTVPWEARNANLVSLIVSLTVKN